MMGLMSRCYRLLGSGCGCVQVVVPGSRGSGNMRGGFVWGMEMELNGTLHIDGLGGFFWFYVQYTMHVSNTPEMSVSRTAMR